MVSEYQSLKDCQALPVSLFPFSIICAGAAESVSDSFCALKISPDPQFPIQAEIIIYFVWVKVTFDIPRTFEF